MDVISRSQVVIQRPAASIAAGRREELVQTIDEFLSWLESSKGLRLCEAFKPQYDWYSPVLANKRSLAREFLGKRATPEQEHRP